MKNFTWICLVLLSGVFACKQEKFQTEKDRDVILAYIQEKNLDALEHPSGLFYIIHDPGTGTEMPTARSSVEIKYKGYFTDGTVFEETKGSNTAEFNLQNLITAWQIGIPLLKKGGSITLIVPSNLGYGYFGSGIIPGNTVILFDIELINFS